MLRRSSDLIVVMLLTVLDITLLIPDDGQKPIKTLAVLPMILVLPGYALTAALFVRRKLDPALLLLLSVGLSLVLTIWFGLLANFTAFGIQSTWWKLAYADFILIAALIALIRRNRARTERWLDLSFLRMKVRSGVILAVAFSIVLLALILARRGSSQIGPGFTQFSMVPADSQKVRIGIQNFEKQHVAYKVDLLIGTLVVYEFPRIELDPNGKWEITIPILNDWIAPGNILDATLYRLDNPSAVYRHVSLFLDQP